MIFGSAARQLASKFISSRQWSQGREAMMRTRSVVHPRLTKSEEMTLKMGAGAGKTERGWPKRSKVILLSFEGLSLPEISRKTGMSTQKATKGASGL
jgi:hypothetical protein